MISFEELRELQNLIYIRDTVGECWVRLNYLCGLLVGEENRARNRTIENFMGFIHEIEIDTVRKLKSLIEEVEQESE